jgi:hypothetical protein
MHLLDFHLPYNTEITSNVQSVPRQSPDIYWHAELCSQDRVQYSTVHIPNVFCDGHLQIINCVSIVRKHWVFHRVHRYFLITLCLYNTVNTVPNLLCHSRQSPFTLLVSKTTQEIPQQYRCDYIALLACTWKKHLSSLCQVNVQAIQLYNCSVLGVCRDRQKDPTGNMLLKFLWL